MNEDSAASLDMLKVEEAKQQLAALPAVNRTRLRQQRLDRLQAELRKRDIGGMLLYDPINEHTGYEGEFKPDMTVSVESYIGEKSAKEGVKLEEMVRITDTGCELIARFPFEQELLI